MPANPIDNDVAIQSLRRKVNTVHENMEIAKKSVDVAREVSKNLLQAALTATDERVALAKSDVALRRRIRDLGLLSFIQGAAILVISIVWATS